MEIAVMATGGTIASRHDGQGQLVVSDDVDDLLSAVPTPAGVTLARIQVGSAPSFTLSPNDMLAVVAQIRELLDSGCEGATITHGTDTMEETAYLIGQYFPRNTRIVLTGAQRGADEPDSDGRRNLADAIRVASFPVALGPVVVLGGVAVAAVEARKVHTSSLLAFTGGDAGVVALVDEDGVHVRGMSQRGGYYADAPLPESLPRVDLVKLVAGADGVHVEASLRAGARGIVLEAFGSGNATVAVVDAIRDTTEAGVPVLVVTRTGRGRVRSIYGGKGGGAELASAGAFFASDLTGPQARMALSMVLAHERPEAVEAAIDAIVKGALR